VETKEVLKSAAIVLAAVVIGGGGYVAWRYWQVSQIANTPDIQINTVSDIVNFFKSAPPMICTLTSVNFNEFTSGTMYVYNDQERVDITYLSQNDQVVHEIYNSSGAYIWEDNSNNLSTIGLNTPMPDTSEFAPITSTKNCSVWWNPDPSLFELPDGKISVPYQSQ
jgi:hypothetical protein